MDVKVYTTPTCGYCHQLKAYLRERGMSWASLPEQFGVLFSPAPLAGV